MEVFNIAGSRVWSYHKQGATASDYQLIWDGTDDQLRPVRSGMYMAKINTGNESGQIRVSINQ
jgi:hypothetical protein